MLYTWHLQTMSASIANRSTTFPFPSSPHWAPSTTVTLFWGSRGFRRVSVTLPSRDRLTTGSPFKETVSCPLDIVLFAAMPLVRCCAVQTLSDEPHAGECFQNSGPARKKQSQSAFVPLMIYSSHKRLIQLERVLQVLKKMRRFSSSLKLWSARGKLILKWAISAWCVFVHKTGSTGFWRVSGVSGRGRRWRSFHPHPI